MKKHTVILLGLACAATLSAQSYHGQGYGYFAPGGGGEFGKSGTLGVGFDGVFYKGLGVSGDVGYIWPLYSDGFRRGLGLFSIGPSYSFVFSDHARVIPFVTAGYTLGFREGTANLWNWGGGATFWAHPHVGFRVEFRDYHWVSYGYSERFNAQVRFGVSFR